MRRRDVVLGMTGLGLAAGVGSLPASARTVRFDVTPFTLGVASGDPTAYGVTLWTRLATAPLEATGGIDPVPVMVVWQVAADDKMQSVVASGRAVALPELAHSVRVTVQGLEPGRHYWYRFGAGGAESRVGRTRTLPDPRAALSSLRFATASCQHYKQGLFVAYDRMIEDDVDFLVHLGDYFYETPWGKFRSHVREEKPETLDDYRVRHALYKTDESLQNAHASFPFFTVLDNHDAQKDYDPDPAALARRAAAYQAWVEHMPARGTYETGASAFPSQRVADFGDLMRISMLDTRQFRDDMDLCRDLADKDYGFTIYRPVCDPVVEEQRTMLGREQELWLDRAFKTSAQRWNVVASTVLFAPFEMHHNNDIFRYEGSWDYYPANRERVLAGIEAAGLSNPVILSGDVHSNWAVDVRRDSADPASPIVASELLTTSISSGWPPPLDAPIKANLTHNAHVHHYDSTGRGYMLHEVTAERWMTDMRVVDTVESLDAKVSTQARFVVENGRSGVQTG